jgi:hypothetical protein
MIDPSFLEGWKHTEVHWCPITSTYTLYNTRLDESYLLSPLLYVKNPRYSITYIINWFNREGVKGIKKAERLLKVKSSPLWKALNDTN